MKIEMRRDLAEEGLLVPAGLSYEDYDDLQQVIYLSAEDLDGAEEYDNGIDPDSHAFNVIKLKDGRVFYMINADLDIAGEDE